MDPDDVPLAKRALAPLSPADESPEMDPADLRLLRGLIAKLAFATRPRDPRMPRAGEPSEAWVKRICAMRLEDSEVVFKDVHAVFAADCARFDPFSNIVQTGLSGWIPASREEFSVWRRRLSKGDEFVALMAYRVNVLQIAWSDDQAWVDVCWG